MTWGGYLIHYGIPDMHWGERRFQDKSGKLTPEGKIRYRKTSGLYDNPDGTKNVKKIRKDAAKDAKEYARAKAYYGEGAGTRRKQIKNLISERMKDPDYKKEFEKQVSVQDMSKHQKAANRERKVNDTKNSVKRTGRGIKNLIYGFGSASMSAVVLYNAAKITGADKMIAQFGRSILSKVMMR